MIRKLLLASVLFIALTTAGYAQYNVNLSVVLDASGTVGGAGYCNAYNPGDDTFLSSVSGYGIGVISAVSGVPTGASYNMTGQNIGGLAFFGITADTSGNAYGVNANSGALIRWANTTVLGATLATGCQFTRNMGAMGSGLSTVVMTCGGANTGDVDIYGTTDDITYYIIDSATGFAKSGFALDSTLTTAWGNPDTSNQLNKVVKVGGFWVSENLADGGAWDKANTPSQIGPMGYDDVNGLILGCKTDADTAYALDSVTGKTYGSVVLADDGHGLAGYNGGYVTNLAAGSGRFYLAQRSGTPAGYHVAILDYGVTSVNDWTLY
jgi:hypothetical protein